MVTGYRACKPTPHRFARREATPQNRQDRQRMDGPWQDAQAPDRLAAPRAGARMDGTLSHGKPNDGTLKDDTLNAGVLHAGALHACAPAEATFASEYAPQAGADSTTGQGSEMVYAPIDISGFRSPQLPKLMREFSPLATVVRRPSVGATAIHALDMSDLRAEELAEQAKARSMHLVVLFEQVLTPKQGTLAPADPASPTLPTTSAGI